MDKKKAEIFKVLKTLRVLYVEDDKSIRSELELNVKNFFLNFTTAVDGRDGLEKFNCEKMDMIITDIEMPNLNGLDMIRELREIRKYDVPIIVTTAFNEVDYLEKALDLCVDGYVSKPFKIMKLFEVINRASAKVINKRLQKELYTINKNLEDKVEEKLNELREKDKVMLNQSRYALMGEMIDAIGHQWKQPLNVINLITIMLDENCDIKNFDYTYCKETSKKIFFQIEHLSQTLDEFRGFFRVNKVKTIFSVENVINSVLLLVKDEYAKERIDIKVKGEDLTMDGFANELKHVFLNIINNAKDAFIERNIKEREIEFEISKIKNNIVIYIRDNADGIGNEEVFSHIFDLNFTTKKGKGSGLGLHLAKIIIDNMQGEISAKNSQLNGKNGLEFKIVLKG